MGADRTKDIEDMLLAERAAEWLVRLPAANRSERAEFLRWLKQSPKHVREMLLAMCCDELLHDIDPQRTVDLDSFVAKALDNVVRLPALPHPAKSSG